MRYRLGMEDIEPDHYVAWALDLPGCFSSARSEADAVAHAPERIAGYYAWLAGHDGTDDLHAGHARDVAEHLGQLHVHLLQRLLHVR